MLSGTGGERNSPGHCPHASPGVDQDCVPDRHQPWWQKHLSQIGVAFQRSSDCLFSPLFLQSFSSPGAFWWVRSTLGAILSSCRRATIHGRVEPATSWSHSPGLTTAWSFAAAHFGTSQRSLVPPHPDPRDFFAVVGVSPVALLWAVNVWFPLFCRGEAQKLSSAPSDVLESGV